MKEILYYISTGKINGGITERPFIKYDINKLELTTGFGNNIEYFHSNHRYLQPGDFEIAEFDTTILLDLLDKANYKTLGNGINELYIYSKESEKNMENLDTIQLTTRGVSLEARILFWIGFRIITCQEGFNPNVNLRHIGCAELNLQKCIKVVDYNNREATIVPTINNITDMYKRRLPVDLPEFEGYYNYEDYLDLGMSNNLIPPQNFLSNQ